MSEITLQELSPGLIDYINNSSTGGSSNGKINYKQINIVCNQDNQTVFNIPIETLFNPNVHVYFLSVNGVLFANEDYDITATTITFKAGIEGLTNGSEVILNIFSVNDPGTIGKELLTQTLQDEITAKVNKTDIVNNLTTGGIDKVLSAEQGKVLKNDIVSNTNKIGDLPSLTTTQKGSLVGAVNEVDDEIGILSVDRGYLKPILKYNISLNTLIENGKYAINSPLDAPIDGIGWCTVDVTIVTTSYVTQVLTIAQTGTPNRLGRIFKRQIDNGIPKDWDELATTEKTEILFPYAEGITQISQTETCSVVKCNNQVTLIINCSKNDGFQVGNTTLGFLPVGFRPSVEMKISGVAVYPTIAHGACIVMPTGGVVFRAGQTGQSRVSFVVSYYV